MDLVRFSVLQYTKVIHMSVIITEKVNWNLINLALLRIKNTITKEMSRILFDNHP